MRPIYNHYPACSDDLPVPVTRSVGVLHLVLDAHDTAMFQARANGRRRRHCARGIRRLDRSSCGGGGGGGGERQAAIACHLVGVVDPSVRLYLAVLVPAARLLVAAAAAAAAAAAGRGDRVPYVDDAAIIQDRESPLSTANAGIG